jgi:type IV pilus assembly protein PilA
MLRETITSSRWSRRFNKDSESGFSLIELAVVVVCLGVLVAVAVPLVGAIQDSAEQAAADAASANAASVAAADIAEGNTPSTSGVVLGNATQYTFAGVTDSLSTLCVTATSADGVVGAAAGPGC